MDMLAKISKAGLVIFYSPLPPTCFLVERDSVLGRLPAGTQPRADDDVDDPADDGEQRTFIEVDNGNAGSCTVTVTYPPTSQKLPGYGSITPADLSVAVASGAKKLIGPFPRGFIASDGTVAFACSVQSSVLVRALRLPKAD